MEGQEYYQDDREIRTLDLTISPEGDVNISLTSENNSFEELKEVAEDILNDLDIPGDSDADYIG